ncbi:MAG: lysophospholipase [Ruminococcaceae bacterium]|nr:lysophospholipase [Oscillospiraceae bacterium]
MKTILFQGDSITDGDRIRENESDLGKGYPAYVSARLGLENPQKYQFFNRGINGNRIVDIYARIKADIINIKPDFLSILVGVNDVWHDYARNNGISAEKYEKIYSMLIEEIMSELPETKIMIIEPFILREEDDEKCTKMLREEVCLRSQAAKRIADKYDLLFLPLQKALDDMASTTQKNYWLRDGIHPTIFFHQYIADRWFEMFGTTGI